MLKSLKLLFTICFISLSFTVHAQLKVVASIFPMAEFCRAVGGDLVQVRQMVPDGTEPHDFEPSPKDLAEINQAQVLVYNGLIENWVKSVLQTSPNLYSVEAGKDFLLIDGKTDPHVWISPKLAIKQVEKISHAFIKADPAHKQEYTANTQKYLTELAQLDKEFSQLQYLSKRRIFATNHAAFAHLAKDYNLTMLAVMGLSPEAEPTPGDLQKVIQTIQKNNLRYIFFETLASPKLAELVAQETGAQAAVLDPIEGVTAEHKANYLDLQKQNLVALQKEFAQ